MRELFSKTPIIIWKFFRGFEADPRTSKFELEAIVPQVTLRGKYKINGKVLILPITGKGRSDLTLDNMSFRVKFTPKVTTKNGKNYIQLDKFKLTFDTTKWVYRMFWQKFAYELIFAIFFFRLTLYFENLFNGDKLLGDNMNLFLNENWSDILRELKPSIVDAFTTIISSVINSMFSKIAYDDIFEP